VGLDLLLHTGVGKRSILSGDGKELSELGISYDLTLVGRVLEVVVLDILAKELGNLDTGLGLISRPAGKLGKLLGDLDRLHETGLGVNTVSLPLLFGDLGRVDLDSLDLLDDAPDTLGVDNLLLQGVSKHSLKVGLEGRVKTLDVLLGNNLTLLLGGSLGSYGDLTLGGDRLNDGSSLGNGISLLGGTLLGSGGTNGLRLNNGNTNRDGLRLDNRGFLGGGHFIVFHSL